VNTRAGGRSLAARLSSAEKKESERHSGRGRKNTPCGEERTSDRKGDMTCHAPKRSRDRARKRELVPMVEKEETRKGRGKKKEGASDLRPREVKGSAGTFGSTPLRKANKVRIRETGGVVSRGRTLHGPARERAIS